MISIQSQEIIKSNRKNNGCKSMVTVSAPTHVVFYNGAATI